VQRLQAAEQQMRDGALKDKAAVVIDGWDNVGRNQLVNALISASKGFFFQGMAKLGS